MKKKSIALIAIGVFLIASIVFLIIYKIQNQFECSETKEDTNIAFAVVSDIHDNDTNLQDAINNLHEINPDLDALILNGDTVNQGLKSQYDNMKRVLNVNKEKLPEKIIKNIGNHEGYNYSDNGDTQEEVTNMINMYLDFSGYDRIYHDTWVNGYHFISLGTDSTDLDKVGYTTAYISDEQINWLEEIIKEKYEKGKPIFVFIHQPVDMDFFGLDVTGIDKNDEIKQILSRYPETILFTSHTHHTPNKEIDEKKAITMVNTGSLNSNFVEDESNERGFSENKDYCNGLYVEVIKNQVVVRAIDFKNNEYIYTRVIN